jgi:acetyl esterase
MPKPTIDPDIAGWLLATTPDEEPTTLEESRALSVRTSALALSTMNRALIPASEEDIEIPGGAGTIPARVLRPKGDGPTSTVVYFHGGGWTVGTIDTHLGHARRICTQANMVVVSVGYRVAPEDRFPAAFEDAVAATEWAAQHTIELGGIAGTLVTAGDSAGAQLAASVAIARRDAGLPLSAQLLLYPVTDVTGCYQDPAVNAHYASRISNARGFGLTLVGMANYAKHYVDVEDSVDWRVSPIKCADLRGVAPAVLHTATLDVLRTEGIYFGYALRDAGVPVITAEFHTLNHSYFGLGGVSAVADGAAGQAAEDLIALLKQTGAEV